MPLNGQPGVVFASQNEGIDLSLQPYSERKLKSQSDEKSIRPSFSRIHRVQC